MPGRATIRRTISQVQPIWSTSSAEARTRVIKLYKTWYRQMPHIVDDYDLPQSTSQCRAKLHEEFMKHKYITDIRQIDTLLMEKQLELKEICFLQKDRSHLLNYWPNNSDNASKPTPFLSNFLIGQN